jgi:hypothetical protein
LFAPISADQSTWSIVDGKELVLEIEKLKEEWWPHVVTTDPKIDVTKIEPAASSLADLDDETRATVEKLMWEQRKKAAGESIPDDGNSASQGLPKGFDFPSVPETAVDPAEQARRKKILEKFKKQHPEMDFSRVQNF